jgi:hypothetical protein
LKLLSKAIFYSVFITVFVILFTHFRPGEAQTLNDWEFAKLIPSSLETEPYYPVILGDKFGGVHLFWSGKDGYIYYSSFASEKWSEPNEILKGEGVPSAVIDSIGMIHLIWMYGGEIVYSSAPANKASDAKKWSRPILLGVDAQSFSLTVDRENGLHIVFQSQRENPGSYYIGSKDLGFTWQEPVLLMSQPELTQVGTDSHAVDITTDGIGRIHILISSKSAAKIYYFRSVDEGYSWEKAIEVDPDHLVEVGEIGQKQTPAIASIGKDEVHLFYFARGEQGEPCARYHQWSSDGGGTWTSSNRILGNLMNCTGPIGWALDGNNDLYIVTSGRGGSLTGETVVPMYISYWSENDWSEPTPVIPNITVECPGIAISQGNLFFVIGCSGDPAIYFTKSMSQLSSVIPEIFPTEVMNNATPLPPNRTSIQNGENQAIKPTQNLVYKFSKEPVHAYSSQLIVILGIIFSTLLVILIIIKVRYFSKK